LTLVIDAPKPAAEAASAKLNAAARTVSLPSESAVLTPLIEEMNVSLATRKTIITWAIPMLVTFTEAYLQDALTLLISSAFQSSSSPGPIVEEITSKWIKGTIRSGNPHKWVNQLKKFGVTRYPEDLAGRLQKTWDLRHQIIVSFR
jgi:hypothetical protein